jgi:ligand-binding sensor domain-containing protein
MFFCLIYVQTTIAQPVCHVSSYYNTSNNEPLHHVCGILQDKNGMIWIISWGGMFCFDEP